MKSYIGEGKSAKTFAKEYLERRSRFNAALKARNQRHEDDLLTPAQAINPNSVNNNDDVGANGVGVANSARQASGSGAANGGSAGARGGKNKKKANKGKKGNNDASHLLGFSVTSSERVNAGEMDYGQ